MAQSLSQIAQAKRRSVDRRGDSAVPGIGMMNGGRVRGPGTPTSDSVLARLSTGEDVLPNDTVSAVGGGNHAAGVQKIAQLIAATHKPVNALAGFADGGSPWDAQYAKGGGLALANMTPPSTAPTSSGPPLAAAATPKSVAAIASPPMMQSVPIPQSATPVPAIGSLVSRDVVPERTDAYAGWDSMVANQPFNKQTGYPALANGGPVGRVPAIGRRPLAGYANGGPDDDPLGAEPGSDTVGPAIGRFAGDVAGAVGTGARALAQSAVATAAQQSGQTPYTSPLAQVPAATGASGGWDQPAAPSLAARANENYRAIGAYTAPTVDPSGAPAGPSPPYNTGRLGQLPDGISMTGLRANSYQGTGTTPAIGTMSTEDANTYSAAKLAAMNANDAQNRAAATQGSILASQSISDRMSAEHAAQAARVDAASIMNGPGMTGNRQGFGTAAGAAKASLSADQARAAQALANTSRGAYDATLGGPPLAAQAANVQRAGEESQRANLAQADGQQSLAQRALLNPLAVQTAQQGVQKGQYELQGQARMQQTLDTLHNAQTPEERNQARASLLAMNGKGADWDVKTIGGRVAIAPDGTSTIVGGYGVLYNKLTNEHQLIGPPPQSELNDRGTQFTEGQRGTLNGMRGTIKNGKFAPD